MNKYALFEFIFAAFCFDIMVIELYSTHDWSWLFLLFPIGVAIWFGILTLD